MDHAIDDGVDLQRLELLARHFIALQPGHRFSARDHAIIRHAVVVLQRHDSGRSLIRPLEQLDHCDVIDEGQTIVLQRAGLRLFRMVYRAMRHDHDETDALDVIAYERNRQTEVRRQRA